MTAMEDSELAHRARRTLERITNAVLATVSPDGRPWNSPLYVAFDAHLTFYWSSHTDTAHSRNIAANASVVLVIFDSTLPDHSGQAVFIEGTARELADYGSIEAGLECIAQRKNESPKAPTEFVGAHPRRVYAAVPTAIWTNVVKEHDGHYFDERVTINLLIDHTRS